MGTEVKTKDLGICRLIDNHSKIAPLPYSLCESIVDIKPIKITRFGDLPANQEIDGLRRRFEALAAQVNDRYRALYGGAATGADAIGLLGVVGEFLAVISQLDAEYGPDAVLPLEDAADATDQALRCLVELESWLERLELSILHKDLQFLVLGFGFWAMRHECEILTAEPIVNALAERAGFLRVLFQQRFEFVERFPFEMTVALHDQRPIVGHAGSTRS